MYAFFLPCIQYPVPITYSLILFLKQFPRAWNQKLNIFLKNNKFVRSDADFSMHVAQVESVKFFIVIYVDDLIFMCNNKDKLLQVIFFFFESLK
jgi:hypothetical protein